MKKILLFVLVTVWGFAGSLENGINYYNHGNYKKAHETLLPLAEDGNDKAQFYVGVMYEFGKGVQKDIQKAKYWYADGAKEGNPSSQYNLARVYQKLGKKENNAYHNAKRWYTKAGIGGIGEAYNNLGYMYLEGEGIQQSKVKAFNYFEKSAAMKCGLAYLNMGYMYAWDKKMRPDKIRAYEYLQDALALGEPKAKGYIAQLCKESPWACER